MTAYRLQVEEGPVSFHASEGDARAAYAEATANPGEAQYPPFRKCAEHVIIDPGKAGILAALTEQCNR